MLHNASAGLPSPHVIGLDSACFCDLSWYDHWQRFQNLKQLSKRKGWGSSLFPIAKAVGLQSSGCMVDVTAWLVGWLVGWFVG